ncbi:GAF and ANTAR domain-containing protein [Streptomyces sp. 549]|uniref:GAF and ANTAR domain-containing protein n=1 Tax=Streptomyces sp. 549 TaxID=3049076 RepID=UPI0024C35FB9|nr:GAF and ANTAR domain-containing protein [Streptomyces sp. 549]MDK1473009.1 GAF and ANTAR domain-containing protein [Streptomyces sp. 549]
MTTPPGAGSGSGGLGDQALAQLHSLLLGTERVEEFLQDLVKLTATELNVSCGITIRPDGRPTTAAASDARVGRFDEAQYEAGRGPCLEALETGRPNLVPDMRDERRWDDYAPKSLEAGVLSVYALPLTPFGYQRPLGAMNLYSSEACTFDEVVRSEARSFATYAAGALGVALKIAGHVEFGQDLQAALRSRAVIDQALGVIMAQQRCSPDQAFEILRRISQNRNVKLHRVAAAIVQRVSGEPPRPGSVEPRGDGPSRRRQ